MASLKVPSDALFIMKVLGKENLLLKHGGLPGKDINTSFQEECSTYTLLCHIATQLAIYYKVSYVNNQIVPQENTTDIKTVVEFVKNVGMIIPQPYKTSVSASLTYLQTYGHLYIPFNIQTPNLYLGYWAFQDDTTFLTKPLLSGYDIYLNSYLETHLRDLFSDTELFTYFPFLDEREKITPFNSREEMINNVLTTYQPVGTFFLSLGFKSMELSHTYMNTTKSYKGIYLIKTIAQHGVLLFDGQGIHPIGLYQLAFLFNPTYSYAIHGTKFSDKTLGILTSLYKYFLSQIKIAETKLEKPIRFSDRLTSFNDDLSKN